MKKYIGLFIISIFMFSSIHAQSIEFLPDFGVRIQVAEKGLDDRGLISDILWSAGGKFVFLKLDKKSFSLDAMPSIGTNLIERKNIKSTAILIPVFVSYNWGGGSNKNIGTPGYSFGIGYSYAVTTHMEWIDGSLEYFKVKDTSLHIESSYFIRGGSYKAYASVGRDLRYCGLGYSVLFGNW